MDRSVFLTFLLILGKLQHKNNAIVKERRVVSKNNIIIPIYTVYIPAFDQVRISVLKKTEKTLR
jgi:hypothetical protein